MTVDDKGLDAHQGKVVQGTGDPRASRGLIIAAVIALAVLLVGGALWSQRDAGSAQEAADTPKTDVDASTTTYAIVVSGSSGEYPAQFVNRGAEIELMMEMCD